jgi:hypothetical protein
MSLLEQLVGERLKRELKDSREGLAFCNHCDAEYTDAQVITIEDEKSCPECKNPEKKTYYYPKDGG